jgi:hypothetical protein
LNKEMNVNSKETNKLKLQAVQSLKRFGFVNVTTDNITSDEVYRFFFGRFLKSRKGASSVLDTKIEELLKAIAKAK